MRLLLLGLACATLGRFTAHAAEPITFARQIAPLIYRSCVPCHYAGGSGPFPLTSYPDVRKHAAQIAAVTRSRYMPPWLPEHGVSDFAGDLSLREEEIDEISKWVDQGALEGSAAETPAPPEYSGGWRLGPPDLVVKAERPFKVPADGADVFWNFILKPQLTQSRFVRAIDIRPSNLKIIHHANMVIDRFRSQRYREAPPGSGFAGMDLAVAGTPLDLDGHPLFWKPGTIPYSELPGMAWRLDPGNDLILNVHLQPSGKTSWEQPEVGLYFTGEAPAQFPYLLELEHDGTLDIPAGVSDFVVKDTFRLPIDTQVMAIYPHAHYLGKRLEAWATLPDGSRRWLIRIPDWDQNWQAVYRYRSPVHLPASSIVEIRYVYDNSDSNPRNPNHPSKRVQGGNLATDEMGHLWLEVLPEYSGDARRIYAEAWARRQLEKYPDSYEADVALGAIALSRLHATEAVGPLRRAVLLQPESAIAHNLYGSALSISGQNTEALEQFQLAVQKQPDLLNARFNLAHALVRRGDHAGALAQLQLILKDNPGDRDAQGYLDQLRGREPAK